MKDLLCLLRWAENPRDAVAAFRVLQLLPGVGPGPRAARPRAPRGARASISAALPRFRPPAAAAEDWPGLCALLGELRDRAHRLARAGRPRARAGTSRISSGSTTPRTCAPATSSSSSRSRPPIRRASASSPISRSIRPSASGDEAGPPHLDEDYLILSTIHSAKGQEWDVVYVLNAADGCIPSDMATGSPEQIEEERRLLYVAMTRARDHLHVVHPLRFFTRDQHRHGDRHVYAPRTRFLPDAMLARFERHATAGTSRRGDAAARRAARGRGGEAAKHVAVANATNGDVR